MAKLFQKLVRHAAQTKSEIQHDKVQWGKVRLTPTCVLDAESLDA